MRYALFDESSSGSIGGCGCVGGGDGGGGNDACIVGGNEGGPRGHGLLAFILITHIRANGRTDGRTNKRTDRRMDGTKTFF